jgi:hypothetical protein
MNLRDLPVNVAVGLILAIAVTIAVLLLWMRDRWWDSKGVSSADRDRYQKKLKRGNAWVSIIFDLIVSAGFLAKGSRGGQPGQYITYCLLGLLFLWLGYRRWKRIKADDGYQEMRPPGAPPPIE